MTRRVFNLMVAFPGYTNHVVALSGIAITGSSVSHELVDGTYYNVEESCNANAIVRFCIKLLAFNCVTLLSL